MAPESSPSVVSKGKQPIRRASNALPPTKRARTELSSDELDVDLELETLSSDWSDEDDSPPTPDIENDELVLEDRDVRYSDILRQLQTAINAARIDKKPDRVERLIRMKDTVAKDYDKFARLKRDGLLPEQQEAQARGIAMRDLYRERMRPLTPHETSGRSDPPATPSESHVASSSRAPATIEALMRGCAFAQSPDQKVYYKAINTKTIPYGPSSYCVVAIKSDGRFGIVDPLHCPQILGSSEPYWALAPRRPRADHPASVLWRIPSIGDVENVPSTTFDDGLVLWCPATRGLLHAAVDFLKPLSTRSHDELVDQIRTLDSYNRAHPGQLSAQAQLSLAQFRTDITHLAELQDQLVYALSMFGAPGSFRDFKLQWAHLHRCWVQCWAFIEFRKLKSPSESGIPNPLHPGLDGSGHAVRLCGYGVPVWEIGQMSHAEQSWPWQILGTPENIPQDRGDMPEGWTQNVQAGSQLFRTIATFSRRLADRTLVAWQPQQRLPGELSSLSLMANGRCLAALGAVAGTFAERIHILLPRRVSVWQSALEAIGTDTRSKNATSALGTRLPDPEFLFTPQTPARVFFYVGIWLTHRPHVRQALLTMDSNSLPLKSSAWRVLFDRQPPSNTQAASQASELSTTGNHTKKYKEKLKILQNLSAFLGVEIKPRADEIMAYVWRGHTLHKADFADRGYLESSIGPLTALQRNIITEIAPDGHPLIPTIPPRRDAGLWANNIRDRVRSLEGLRKYLVRWPGTPAWLARVPPLSFDTPEKQLLEFEREAARYYCRVFFDEFGRAPAVPRILRLPGHM
ncbi:hypothetical protein PHLGIDRAFT_123018 [Phlebiopsis gigantea 11061_1 CR5-6]|uniref:Uncharacterized protein n=1 Tax=Phlebiopsis gigantea (strain 11061_1 CR5-6) TaxID=745531 RepID=A0A0C3RZG7_PHLG1|nr:hypothetical protein PHLGIDRAFT_123018 [Phlebiopsis gigantea 11061_1 CR5-6]